MRYRIAPAWRRDGVIAGLVLREQYTTVTDVLTRDGVGPDGEATVEEVEVQRVAPSLVPLLSRGVAIAQGVVWRPSSSPTAPAAPASAKSYLHWNSTTGLYWNGTKAPATAGDALIGWVLTDGAGVVATSSRVLGNGAESTIPAPGVPVAGAGSDGIDTAVPGAVTFGAQVAALDSTALEIAGLAIASNAHSVSVVEATIYYVDLAAAHYLLSGALTSGAASLACTAAPTTIAQGDYVQVNAELLLAGIRSGSNLPITRAQLGTAAASALAGDTVARVSKRVVTAPFAAGFLGGPDAAAWVLTVKLPETRVVAVVLRVVNAYGSTVGTVALTGGAGHGLLLTAPAAGSTADTVTDVTNANLTGSAGQEIYDVAATTQDCIITLPPASSMQGLKKAMRLAYGSGLPAPPNSGYVGKFRPHSGDTIAGSASDYSVTDPGASVTIEAVGSDWAIVAGAGSLTAATVPDAENVDASTTVGVEYGMYGNASAYALTASIVLPSSRPNLKMIHVMGDGAGGTLIELGTLYGPWASSPVPWRSGDPQILQGGATVTRTLTFLCENAAGVHAPSPVTKTVNVQAAKVQSVTASEVGSRYPEDPTRLVWLTIGIVPVLVGNQVPQAVTYLRSRDNGANWSWVGAQTMLTVGQTLRVDFLAPGAAENWKIACVIGAPGGDAAELIPNANLAARYPGVMVTGTIAIGALGLPAPGAITTASVAAAENLKDQDGHQYARIPGPTWTDPADTNAAFVRLTVQCVDAAGNPAPADQGGTEAVFYGPDDPMGDVIAPGKVRATKALEFDYNPAGSAYVYMRYRMYLMNRNATATSDWSDVTKSVLQSTAWSGAGFKDVYFGSLPAGAIPAARLDGLGAGLVKDPSGKPAVQIPGDPVLGLNFETGTFQGWTIVDFSGATGEGWKISGTSPLSGSYSAHSQPGHYTCFLFRDYAPGTSLAGQQFSASIRYTAPATHLRWAIVCWNAGAVTVLANNDYGLAAATNATATIGPFTAPAGTMVVRLQVYMDGTYAAGDYVVDDIRLIPAGTSVGGGLQRDVYGNVVAKTGDGVGVDSGGNLIVRTDGSTLGIDTGGRTYIPAGAVQSGNLAAGSLGDLAKYSSTVRAIGIVFGLPTLPQSSFPQGAIVMNVSDGKVYRNTTGSAWEGKTAPADLFAGTIASGVSYTGVLNAGQVNTGTLTGIAATIGPVAGLTVTMNVFTDVDFGQGGLIVSSSTGKSVVRDGYFAVRSQITGDTTWIQGGLLVINGQQVMSGRRGGPANTTDTTDVAVKFNQLLSALRGHGMIS